jgi:hypothetical protein
MEAGCSLECGCLSGSLCHLNKGRKQIDCMQRFIPFETSYDGSVRKSGNLVQPNVVRVLWDQ